MFELTAFTEFAIIIGMVALSGVVFTKLKQPPLLGYIIAGIVLGPMTPGIDLSKGENIELYSQIGIAFLLFTLGLELKLKELKKLGKVALTTGLGQIIFTSIFGYIISMLLGFSSVASLYIAIALTFSSTMIIVKLLSQKNQLNSLFGRISIGFLLVQDFAAILIIIGLSSFKNVGTESAAIFQQLGFTLVKGVLVAIAILLVSKFIFNPLLNHIKEDREVTFMAIVSWAILLASFMGSDLVGFSIEVGGLLAGISLANRVESLQIENWIKPLREFFLSIFFVLLGMHLDLSNIGSVITPSILFSIFVLLGNPLIVIMIMKYLGYSKKVSFMTSLAVAQISEFSLIVTKFGHNLGHVHDEVLTTITLVGGITMTVSTYMIFNNDRLYAWLEKPLDIFGTFSDGHAADEFAHEDHPEIILFGCHRMGGSLLDFMKLQKARLLIVDYNLDTINKLKAKGYNAQYGDISYSDDMFEAFGLENAKIVISTIPSLKENKALLNYLEKLPNKPITCITTSNHYDFGELYKAGSDFVAYPHLISSELLAKIVHNGKLDTTLVKMREKHMNHLGANLAS